VSGDIHDATCCTVTASARDVAVNGTEASSPLLSVRPSRLHVITDLNTEVLKSGACICPGLLSYFLSLCLFIILCYVHELHMAVVVCIIC